MKTKFSAAWGMMFLVMMMTGCGQQKPQVNEDLSALVPASDLALTPTNSTINSSPPLTPPLGGGNAELTPPEIPSPDMQSEPASSTTQPASEFIGTANREHPSEDQPMENMNRETP